MKSLFKNSLTRFISLLTLLLFCQFSYATGYRLKVRPDLRSTIPIKEQVLQGMTRDLSRTQFLFIPNYGIMAQVTPTAADFIGEQSMYSATPEFAIKNGGDITRAIIAVIPDWYYESAKNLSLYPNIDVRVHDLNLDNIPAGFLLYPAIPGWHADGEFRETYFSQPDLNRVPVSFHIVSTTSTLAEGVSNTRFIDDAMEMEVKEDLPDAALWAEVHRHVEQLDSYAYTDMRDGGVVMFDARSLHKAMPVKATGKRLFFRMSMWHKPNLGDEGQSSEDIGQISKQEQLYLLPKPGFKEEVIDPTQFLPPDQRVIGTFAGTERISHLAQEQSIFGATIDEIKRDGGNISKQLVDRIPADFAPEGFVPVVDMLIYRLYSGYRPFFPNYEGKPQSVNWHLPIDFAAMIPPSKPHAMIPLDSIKTLKELWMAVSSHEDGVNVTEFSGGAQLQDGVMLQTSASAPRRELPTKNRGWRLLMRVRLVAEGKLKPSQVINQQYVDPASEEAGW